MTCFSTVLRICSSALRAVRCMSPASAPTATLNTVRMACRISSHEGSEYNGRQKLAGWVAAGQAPNGSTLLPGQGQQALTCSTLTASSTAVSRQLAP